MNEPVASDTQPKVRIRRVIKRFSSCGFRTLESVTDVIVLFGSDSFETAHTVNASELPVGINGNDNSPVFRKSIVISESDHVASGKPHVVKICTVIATFMTVFDFDYALSSRDVQLLAGTSVLER